MLTYCCLILLRSQAVFLPTLLLTMISILPMIHMAVLIQLQRCVRIGPQKQKGRVCFLPDTV